MCKLESYVVLCGTNPNIAVICAKHSDGVSIGYRTIIIFNRRSIITRSSSITVQKRACRQKVYQKVKQV